MTTIIEGQDPLPELVRDLHIIDTDSHYTEPPDLWTRNASPSIKSRVPQVKRIDGEDRWIIEGDQDWGQMGLCVVAPDGSKMSGRLSFTNFDEMSLAASDPANRVAMLDRQGIQYQILYPNAAGFQANKFLAIEDRAFALEILKLYNTGMAEVQEQSGGRLLPQALVPEWDMGECVKEMQRCHDLGFTGFTIGEKPELQGLSDFTEPHWAPFWDFCNETGRVVNFHIGGSTAFDPFAVPWKSYGPERALAVAAISMYTGNATTIANLCYSGLFDKYDKLKVTSVESGAGWIPFVLEALEYQLDQMIPTEMRHVKRRPTEYFQDHIWASVWFESKTLGPSIELLGPEKFMFMTDFPHPTCLYPEPVSKVAAAVGDSPENLRLVMQDNAAKVYGIAV